MKTQLKDNIFIEGFGDYNNYVEFTGFKYLASKTVLYHGKTSEIPEEIAKECVIWDDYSDDISPIYKGCYRNYYNFDENEEVIDYRKVVGFNTAKESIQSACNQHYCIIYKEK